MAALGARIEADKHFALMAAATTSASENKSAAALAGKSDITANGRKS
jgi:hypothetical protein